MKRDHRDAPTRLKSRSQYAQTLFQRTKLVIDFHPQRLKNPGGGMVTAVPADKLFDRTRKRKSFAERKSLTHLYDQACDAARSRFLSQFAKETSQLLFAVLIYDRSSRQFGSRIHAHVEGTVSHKTETAFCIF